MKKAIILVLMASIFGACGSSKYVYRDIPNLAHPNFDAAGSDEKAIYLADDVMKGMGGRNAWNETRYLRWTYFNQRALLWDKKKERVRIDYLNQNLKIILNYKTMTGRVRMNNRELTKMDSLDKYLQKGKEDFLNDAYWVFMPFLLKDDGVSLKYLGEKESMIGAKCEAIELSFKDRPVGGNIKYHIYINRVSRLVVEWTGYKMADDATPTFRTPWQDYRALGHIMMSGNRGEGKYLAPMGVYGEVPSSAFEDFTELDWNKIKR
jgi:hypothetical protein